MVLQGSSGRGFWRAVWLAAGAIATVEICGFVLLARRLPPEFVNSTIRVTQALAILPLVLAGIALLLEKNWTLVSAPEKWKRWVGGESGLVALLATMPLVLLSVLAQLRPILNQRGL